MKKFLNSYNQFVNNVNGIWNGEAKIVWLLQINEYIELSSKEILKKLFHYLLDLLEANIIFSSEATL